MSKSTDLQSKEGQEMFAENTWFNIMRGLFFAKSNDFKSGGIVCGTAHEGEAIITKSVLGKINYIEKP